MSDLFVDVLGNESSTNGCFDCDGSCHCDCDSANCECNTG